MTGMIEKLLAAFSRAHWLLQWLILSLLALLLYIPVIGNYFVNDDFIVLKKVCLDKELNTDGFFRPLSDISIYANYMFSGFDPLAYRITSIVIHAFNALLLFRFCKRWQWAGNERLQLLFAGISTIFFLTYPFHNEPVVWLLGRASLLASTFAMLALVIVAACNWRDAWKMPLAGICYFIAMTGYESVFVLPAIVFIWLLANATPFKKIMIWMGVFALVLTIHFVIRVQVSGSATGEYGARLFQWETMESLARAVKVAGRLLAPPVDRPPVFAITAAIFGLLILIGIIRTLKISGEKRYIKVQLLAWLCMLLIALIVPFVFGVSTRTSESDRLLYYPSFFLCPLLAFFLLHLFKNRWLPWLTAGVLTYNIIFLQLNNYNWVKASDSVTGLMDIIKHKVPVTNLYIINVPDEIGGAYVFRVGLRDALTVEKLDTTGVIVVNYLEMQENPREIFPKVENNQLFIPPGVMVQRSELDTALASHKYRPVYVDVNDWITYWNGHSWMVLNASALFK